MKHRANFRLGGIGVTTLALVLLPLAMAACTGPNVQHSYPERDPKVTGGTRYSGDPPPATIFGAGGLDISLFGGGDSRKNGGQSGVGVNNFLWRASLDTISFMPVNSADPFGGVIITDWYAPPETPKERFKMNVYILGRDLRADGLRVAVFRQEQNGDGSWTDRSVAKETAASLENKILTRARQLRVVSSEQ